MKITKEQILLGKSINNGYSKNQFDVIGDSWPPISGWIKKLLNKDLTENQINKFIELKDKHLNN